MSAYRVARPELDDAAVELAMLGDMWFRVPSIRIADGHAARGDGRTFMYLFEWESQLLGAAHAMDLLVFGNGLSLPGLAGFTSYDKVAAAMRKSWSSFASTGNPSTPSFTWPEYDLQNRLTVSINNELSVLRDPDQKQRQALGGLFTMNWQQAGL